jgi:methylenetetrahydrofolate reductase (NADPH)
MKIADIFRAKKPISFEIFPPKGELSTESFHATLAALSKLSPDYISVTCSAGGSGGRERTAVLAGAIRKEYGIESCAHLTCINSDEEMLCEDVQRLHDAGVENVLALLGDVIPGSTTRVFRYASQLMRHMQPEGSCVGGAC